MPTISVIVPVYKVEKYINRCVDSILGQTYADFELILVDDGSPDNCGTICDEYAVKDGRVVVIHQENGGLSAARNAGIDWAFANSYSQWLSFIDSDDWVHPEYLDRLLDAALKNGTSVSICGYATTNGEKPEVDPQYLMPKLWNTEDFFVAHNVNAIIACGKLYRKECFEIISYPVGKIHEDEFVTYRILFEKKQVVVISAPMYFYYVNMDGITKKAWSMKRLDAIDALEQQMLYMKEHNYQKAYEKTAQSYAWRLVESYQKVHEDFPSEKRWLRIIRKKLQKLLRQSSELFELEKNYHFYETAFPLEMKIYWYWHAVKRRLMRNA